MRFKIRRFHSEETGSTAIELILIAAGLSVALITLTGQFSADEERHVVEQARLLIDGLNFRFMF